MRELRGQDGTSTPSASRPEMVAEVGFEPTTTLWVVLAYETSELDRSTLLRDKMFGRPDWTCTNEARRAAVLQTACLAAHTPAEKLVEPRGVAPRSSRCECVALLLELWPRKSGT